MTRHRGSAILLILFLVATMAAPVAAASSSGDGVWIVTLEDGHPATLHAAALVQRNGGTLRQVYSHALNGFSFRGSEQAARNLQRSPLVARVEADQPVYAASNVVPTGVSRIGAPQAHTEGYRGAGAHIAILDTGIDSAHPALEVAVDLGKNCIDPPATTADKHGHGTHVAGTASAYHVEGFVGVATQATLVPVKVLGDTGSGSWESVICGIDHVTASQGTGSPIGVANMSLSGAGTAGDRCDSSALRQAVCNSVAAGVVHTVAAGNDAADVANSIPAAFPEVITVSALDLNRCARVGRPPRTECHEGLASFSNYGAGIDVIAPGVGIYSTLPGGGYGTKSGTSMAAPHVAGVVALMRSANPGLTPAEVRGLLQGTGECPDTAENNALSGVCSDQGQWFYDPDGIAEPLINAPRAAAAAGTPPPSNGGPVAGFTYDCDGLACTFTNTSTHDPTLTATYAWAFGDGATSTAKDLTHTYVADGTYTVALTVTDSENQTDTTSQPVSVSQDPHDPTDPGEITLSVTGYKVRGQQKADLTWTGAVASSVDITRDGSPLATVSNTGEYTDHINRVGGGSYTYQVCEQNSPTACSPQVTITF